MTAVSFNSCENDNSVIYLYLFLLNISPFFPANWCLCILYVFSLWGENLIYLFLLIYKSFYFALINLFMPIYLFINYLFIDLYLNFCLSIYSFTYLYFSYIYLCIYFGYICVWFVLLLNRLVGIISILTD
jgi:hypothetical protein